MSEKAGELTWRARRAETVARLSDAGIIPAEAETRFLIEAASGYDADEWLAIADAVPQPRALARLLDMVERRIAGEPLQYVLGSWSFRGLDLLVDKRVLIPRPETEMVVEVALEEATRLGLRRARRRRLTLVEPKRSEVVVDLGTGSGAIALALEAELPDVEVWATDVSDDALAVARANIGGCAAARVRVAPAAPWFDALPDSLRGTVRMIVSNPPYVAEPEVPSLPDEVAAYEPHGALVAGVRGTEALEAILTGAPSWLTPGGTVVLEIAPHQASVMTERTLALGFEEALVKADLTGRARVLVARTG